MPESTTQAPTEPSRLTPTRPPKAGWSLDVSDLVDRIMSSKHTLGLAAIAAGIATVISAAANVIVAYVTWLMYFHPQH